MQISVGTALQVKGTECTKSLRQELTGLPQGTERSFDEDTGKELKTSSKRATEAGHMKPGSHREFGCFLSAMNGYRNFKDSCHNLIFLLKNPSGQRRAVGAGVEAGGLVGKGLPSSRQELWLCGTGEVGRVWIHFGIEVDRTNDLNVRVRGAERKLHLWGSRRCDHFCARLLAMPLQGVVTCHLLWSAWDVRTVAHNPPEGGSTFHIGQTLLTGGQASLDGHLGILG